VSKSFGYAKPAPPALQPLLNPVQWGDSLQAEIDVLPGGTTIQASKDLVWWQGDAQADVVPWRIYLGPWGDAPVRPDGKVNNPTPMLPLKSQVRAVVQWGSGGQTLSALVDWPVQGQLIQVSGQSVRVRIDLAPDELNVLNLGRPVPRFTATLCPEPGGGDSVAPAQFTVRPTLYSVITDDTIAAAVPSGGGAGVAKGIVQIVPSWARTWACYLNQAEWSDPVWLAQYDVVGTLLTASWWDPSTADQFNALCAGSITLPLVNGANRIVVAYAGAPPLSVRIGTRFDLDL